MKKFLTLFLLLLSPLSLIADDNGRGSSGKDPIIIHIQPIPKPKPNKGPQSPSNAPLTGTLMGDCLSVFCHYDVMGEVVVTNNETLETVASESGNLGEGIILTLDNYTPGAMTLTVSILDTEYVGNF